MLYKSLILARSDRREGKIGERLVLVGEGTLEAEESRHVGSVAVENMLDVLVDVENTLEVEGNTPGEAHWAGGTER
ncbi:hypothetical protein AGABI1DRAFT_84895 [Agaricus bisporus var. burnettii JB137-S8]|uniref:Uncharacterized protein n=1 Tax=Agaricus bisporus var. burnettii (strain JB137-S8 / ATCC MYA-4627 / FGSC 10392) TaxID=597362 RepID=K5XBG2_AGABU|nr:uncharacterized protein AGABI1DRAFT_84895 [Agaricus bisporus var. burnettii JB137-S8]EKM80442.1 hypothetical protein AGABI1DRAFT_84895 [Agaricus bisporus var. burnettii JB137-S8]